MENRNVKLPFKKGEAYCKDGRVHGKVEVRTGNIGKSFEKMIANAKPDKRTVFVTGGRQSGRTTARKSVYRSKIIDILVEEKHNVVVEDATERIMELFFGK